MSPLILRRLKPYQNHFRTIYIELKLFIARRKDAAISLSIIVKFKKINGEIPRVFCTERANTQNEAIILIHFPNHYLLVQFYIILFYKAY